jgi:RNA polymerase sigma-54 factor
MQKLQFTQQLLQKLSPQQIQFIKLLQLPTIELESRIEEELEINPALEEGKERNEEQTDFDDTFSNEEDSFDDYQDNEKDDLNLDDYLKHEDYAGYKMAGDGPNPDDDDRESPLVGATSLFDGLMAQVGYLRLNETQTLIAQQLVGSIESDGYIRRELDAIVNDLAFGQNISTDADEIEEVLLKIQSFEPAGIGARSLQECLLIQLERKDQLDEHVVIATQIVDVCFEEFTKKHYDKIQKKFDISDAQIKAAIEIITKLNPKPGSAVGSGGTAVTVIPDFILTNTDGELIVTLNSRNAPELRVSRDYSQMLHTYDKSDKKDKKLKETVTFVKQKLDAAKWFIDAIKQRQQTLLRNIHAIIDLQKEFFLDGDESKLRPMILKDVAEIIDMDISTVSRVVNSKSVQTEFGIYPLKYFFSESIATDNGEDVSSREVKNELKKLIEAEHKSKPLSDDKLVKMLNDQGYNIARRTVAKYREQLQIPVARLRKEL